jgi:hypothetical protein
MNLHTKTIVQPIRYFLTVGMPEVRVASADYIDLLDFSVVAGANIWGVHAEFEGGWFGCMAHVNQIGFADRFGRIRFIIVAWLQRLYRECRLFGVATEFDGGSSCLDFPNISVQA